MNYRNWVLLGMAGLVTVSSAMAADQAAKMDRQLCAVCHGVGGIASSELFPNLAGQPAPYVINQLNAFRDKSRADLNARSFMWGIAFRLSDENIQKLADFYQLQPVVHKGKISDQQMYDLGKNIYFNGNPEKGVAACMACHGEKAEGKDAIPRLGGQNEKYLQRQLKVFSNNERPAAAVMHEIVKGLSDKDIASIAQYLQAQ